MTRFVSFPLALAALSMSLTACGGDDKKSEAAASASTPPSTAASSKPSAPDTTVIKRTTAELTKALLELDDLPSGFTLEKDDPDEDANPFSSSSSRCKTLVKYLNADKAPGAKASVHRTFSAGQEGPYIDFGLDSMGTAAKVADLQETYRDAVTACSKVTMKIEGLGNTSMKVEQISAPKLGTGPFAFRLTGVSGPKRGLELISATTGVEDVVVSIGLIAGQDGDLEGATEAAVVKAQQVLSKKGA
jgi:hypothetical protein